MGRCAQDLLFIWCLICVQALFDNVGQNMAGSPFLPLVYETVKYKYPHMDIWPLALGFLVVSSLFKFKLILWE